jgi:hypothetical protein
MKRRSWNYLVALLLLCTAASSALAQGMKLAVINASGEVWARDLSANSIGPGVKLAGPALFGGSDDRFVVASQNSIAVVTMSGALWRRQVDDISVGPGVQHGGSLFGGPDAKYVVDGGSCRAVFVVNSAGEVWAHALGLKSIGVGNRLNGPSLFGGPNDKYVVYDDRNRRILVVNTRGEVWAHDMAGNAAQGACGFDGVGGGYRLNGSGLFGGPNDKYVVASGGRLLVINAMGEVWARSMTRSAIGPGVKLDGPGLFGGPDDKYVVAYYVR